MPIAQPIRRKVVSWLGNLISQLFGFFGQGSRAYIWQRKGITRATRGIIDKWNKFGVDWNIKKLEGLSKSSKTIYIYLSRVSDSKGYSFPFTGTIAKRTKLSNSTVNKALKDLEKARLLQIERRYSRRGGSSNLYHLRKVTNDYPENISGKA